MFTSFLLLDVGPDGQKIDESAERRDKRRSTSGLKLFLKVSLIILIPILSDYSAQWSGLEASVTRQRSHFANGVDKSMLS